MALACGKHLVDLPVLVDLAGHRAYFHEQIGGFTVTLAWRRAHYSTLRRTLIPLNSQGVSVPSAAMGRAYSVFSGSRPLPTGFVAGDAKKSSHASASAAERAGRPAGDRMHARLWLTTTPVRCTRRRSDTALRHTISRVLDSGLQLFVRNVPFAKLHGRLLAGQRHLCAAHAGNRPKCALNRGDGAAHVIPVAFNISVSMVNFFLL